MRAQMRAQAKRGANAAVAALAALLCAVSLWGTARTAWAEETGARGAGQPVAAPSVTGVDFMEPTAEGWEVLKVQGGAGRTLYLDLEKNGAPLVERMRYVLPDGPEGGSAADGAEGAGKQLAHIVALHMKQQGTGGTTPLLPQEAFGAFDRRDSYTITVHDAAREGAVLYQGAIYPVYATLESADGSVRRELLGLRVQGKTAQADGSLVDEPSRENVGAGATYYTQLDAGEKRVAYALQPTSSGRDNAFVGKGETGYFEVTYREVEAEAVSGAINYVDTEGRLVRTDSVGGITDEGVTATFERSFFVKGEVGEDGSAAPGTYYRAIKSLVGSTVTLTPRQPTYVVRVMEVAGADANAYEVAINYVDQDGQRLWSDEVDVKGQGYQYTLPTTFSMRQTSGVAYYELARVQADRPAGSEGDADAATARAAANRWDEAKPVLRFDGDIADAAYADSFGEEGGKRVLTAVYRHHDASREVKLTVVEVDGSTNREIGRQVLTVSPEQAATYTPAAKTVDGAALVPWAGNAQPLTYTWAQLQEGADLLRYVYYVPEDYVRGAAYDVTVQYLNVATSQVLRTRTVTVDPEQTDFVEILGEERFAQDGEEYVRLDGQETAIRHAYFTPTRTYTLYYRDVNDELSANITVQRTQIIDTERVVTVPGTTVISAAPAPTATAAAPADAAGGADAGATPAPGTVDAGVGPGDGTAVIGDDATPLANNEGVTTGEERIADEENPLAAGVEPGSEPEAPATVAVVATLGALAALAAALFLGLRWRKKKSAADAVEA